MGSFNDAQNFNLKELKASAGPAVIEILIAMFVLPEKKNYCLK